MSVAEQIAVEDRIIIVALAVAAVAAFVIWRIGVRYAGRAKPRHAAAERREAELLLPHGGWVEQHDLDRQVELAIVQAHRAYDDYRGVR